MSWLAVVVLPGSEHEGQDLPHQPGSHYSGAAHDPEEEEEEQTPPFKGL